MPFEIGKASSLNNGRWDGASLINKVAKSASDPSSFQARAARAARGRYSVVDKRLCIPTRRGLAIG